MIMPSTAPLRIATRKSQLALWQAEHVAALLPEICTRPEVGRITGRGNTANLETVLALKPDLILDVGSTSATFVSLADRVQEQTNIPYALLDGRFAGIADSYRSLGALIGRAEDAEKLARYTEDTLKTITGRIEPISVSERPKVYYARGPRGLATGLGGVAAVVLGAVADAVNLRAALIGTAIGPALGVLIAAGLPRDRLRRRAEPAALAD